MKINRHKSRIKRHIRARKKLFGTDERPRICVFRSHKHIYAQAVNDIEGNTIASACTLLSELPDVDKELSPKKGQAKSVGKLIAERLQEKGIQQAIFDRGGYIYHGRVAAVADGVREGGIKI